MNDILSNTLKVVVSFFVALILNKILSVFRKRQLYMSCWNSIENTSLSDNAFTMNASIYNNGKDKEKNVVIKMPNGLNCSVISSTYDYKNESGEIIIDRVLPSEKISLIILVEGERKLGRKIKPRIKSEDTNGKVFLTTDVVPPSAGVLTLTLAVSTTILGAMTYITVNDNSPERLISYVHNSLFYRDYKDNGFIIYPFDNDIIIKNYDIAKKEYPIEFIDARKLNGTLQLKFRLVNKLDVPMIFKAHYEVASSRKFYNELYEVSDFVNEEIREKARRDIYKKYHVDSMEINNSIFTASDEEVILKPNSMGYLILSRSDEKHITLDDMNVGVVIKSQQGLVNKEVALYFESKNNEKIKSLFR